MSFIESYYKNTPFDDLKAGIAVYNPKDMSIDTLNDTFATIHGYDVDELIGMPIENLFISKHMHLFQVKEKKFEVSMEHSAYETLHRKKDGSTFSVFVQITAIKDEKGNIKQKILNVTDISRYKKARQELKKHKLEYRALSENIPDAVVRYDMDIRRVYVNKEWERINGISSDEAIGKSPIELPGVISRQAKEFQEKLKYVVKHEKLYEWDFEFINLYGGVNCYSIRAIPEYDKLGKITGVLTTARDITQRKELEEEKIYEQMHSYFESKLVGMAITSPQKEWLRVNKKLSSMLGYTYLELKSMTWEELTHPDDLNGEVEEYTRMLKGEIDEYIYEKRFIHKNGTIVFAKLLVSCVRNNDKSVDYVLTLIEDITGSVCSQDAQYDLNSTLEERIKDRINELRIVHSKLDMEVAGRKHVQKQLTSREQLFTSVMENFPGFVSKYRLMPDGKEEFLYASKGIYDVYGVTLETALNNISAVREMIHPEDIKSFRDAIEESARTLEVFDVEFRVLHREKGELWLKSRSTPQKQDDGSIIWHGITIDITKRKEAEELLKQREFEFHSLAENIPDNIARFDTEGRYLYINPTHERLLGVTLAEAIGTFIPESHMEVKAAIAQAVATKEKVTIQQKVLGESGEIEIHDVILAPEFNEHGEVVSVLGIGRDIIELIRSEERLTKTKAKLSAVISTIPDLIWVKDENGVYMMCNPSFENFFGAPADDIIGKTDYDFLSKEQADFFRQKDKEAMDAGEMRINEEEIVFAHNSQRALLETRKIPVYNGNEFMGVLGIGRDITERKRKEAEYSTLAENSPDVIVRYDCDLKRVYVNKAWESINSLTRDDVIGKTPTQISCVISNIASSYEKFLKEIIKTKETTDRELSIVDKNGKTIHYNQKGVPEFDSDGKVIGVLTVARDITESKQQEELLKQKEQAFRSLAENSPDAIVRYDLDLKRVYVNPVYERINNISAEDALGKAPSDRSWAILDIVTTYEEYLRSIIKSKKSDSLEFPFDDKNGKTGYLYQTAVPEFNSDGEVISILTVARNITEKKVLEDQLLEQNQFLDSLLNAIPVPIFYKDTETRYKGFNKAFEEFYGKKQEELIGKGVFDIFPPEQAQVFFDADAELFRKGGIQVYEAKARDVQGVDHDVMFHKSVYFDQEGTVAGQIGTILDITERKLMEDALEKNRASLTEAQRVSHTGSWELNFETNELSWSDEVYHIFEIDKNEFRPSYEAFLQAIHPDDRDMVNDVFSESLEKQTTYEIEHRLLMSDGRVKHVLERGETKYSDEGKPLSTLGIVHDITNRKEIEELLRKKELEFRTIMENTQDTVARYDKECVRTYANPSFAKMAGKSVDELLGKKPTHYYNSPQAIAYEEAILRVCNSAKEEEFEFTWPDADGVMITSLIHLVPETDSSGDITSVLATGRNVSKLKEFEVEISKQKDFQESLLRGILEAGLSLSVLENGKYIYTNNNEYAKEYGYDVEKFSETKPDILTTVHPDDREKVMQMYKKRLAGEDVQNNYTIKILRANGEVEHNEISVVLVPNTDPVQTIIVTKDVTKKLENERKVKFLAHHDVLTGLPNRTLIKEKVYRSLEEANKKRAQVAILFIDLDGFKAVNDSLGHSAGDDMLKMVASRLVECIDTKDIISRQGGDEFLVVIPDIQDINDVVKSADKLVNAFKKPFTLRNQSISTSASIGIALYPDHGNDFEQLLQCSDAAMYKAKEAGKNSFCFFTQRMKNEIIVQFQMQNDLKDAVKNKEFILHYQPQVDIKENKIIGAEALLRWEHPKHGMIPPNSFIPIAESSSLIVEIGEWVIMEACRQAAIWNAQGKDITVAVNISAVQFKKGNLEDVVKRALYLSGLEPRYLELELTESILINNTESVLQTVKVIKELEIQLSIDDFGTGYSSLSYLKRFAVDKLKIDQSFVRDIINDNENASIVRTIIQMAKSFNLSSIAEGVEDENVLALVKEFGCDEVQGYHFAKPMIVDDFEDYYMSFNK